MVLLYIWSYPLPPHNNKVNYRNSLEYGKKAQRNHEAYTTWAFPTNLQKMNLLTLTYSRVLSFRSDPFLLTNPFPQKTFLVRFLTPTIQTVSNKTMLADTVSSNTVSVSITMLALLCEEQ